MRTIFIGDIHGCFRELELLLEKLNYSQSQDRLLLVGDLINKGPDSLKVLEFVKSHNIEFVLGNHERAFIKQALEVSDKENSISRLIEKIGQKESQSWASWLKSFPYYIEEDDFIMVHAGLAPNTYLNQQSTRVLSTIRTWDGVGNSLNNPSDPSWWSLYQGEKMVFYGHWAAQGLKITKNSVCLDSGCVYGKQLTAYILEENKIVAVDALDAYVQVS